MYLSGQDLKSLDEAVRFAYKQDELRRLLKFQLNRDLDDITLARSYLDNVFDLVDTANREGWIEQLIVELRGQRKENTDFCRVLDDLITSKAVARHLDGEHLVQLATALSEVVSVAALQEILKAIGCHPEGFRGPLRDYLIKTLVTAVQERWAEDFLQALDERGLPAILADIKMRGVSLQSDRLG